MMIAVIHFHVREESDTIEGKVIAGRRRVFVIP